MILPIRAIQIPYSRIHLFLFRGRAQWIRATRLPFVRYIDERLRGVMGISIVLEKLGGLQNLSLENLASFDN